MLTVAARRQADAGVLVDGEHGPDRDRGGRRHEAGDRGAAAARARARHRQDGAVPRRRAVAGRARLDGDRRHHRRAVAIPADRCLVRRRVWSCCLACRRSRCSPASWRSRGRWPMRGLAWVLARRDAADRRRVRGAGPQFTAHPARRARRRAPPRSRCPPASRPRCWSGWPRRLALGVTAGPLAELFTAAAGQFGACGDARAGSGTGSRPASWPTRQRTCWTNGFRLALVAAHDDGDAVLRIVYLFLAGRPDRRVELDALSPQTASGAADRWRICRFPLGRFEREMSDLYGIRAGRPSPAAPAGPPRALAAGLASDAARCRARRRSSRRRADSRSSPSTAPGSTRFRSAPCMPG